MESTSRVTAEFWLHGFLRTARHSLVALGNLYAAVKTENCLEFLNIFRKEISVIFLNIVANVLFY